MLNFASKPCLALVAMVLLVFSTSLLLSPNEVTATNIGTCYADANCDGEGTEYDVSTKEVTLLSNCNAFFTTFSFGYLCKNGVSGIVSPPATV